MLVRGCQGGRWCLRHCWEPCCGASSTTTTTTTAWTGWPPPAGSITRLSALPASSLRYGQQAELGHGTQAIWDLTTGRALSGVTAGRDFVYVVRYLGERNQLVTAGKLNITLWSLDDSHKLQAHAVSTGKLQRIVSSVAVTPQFVYLGTNSGDVLEVRRGAHPPPLRGL